MSISAIRYPLSAILIVLLVPFKVLGQDPSIESPDSPNNNGEVCIDFGVFPSVEEEVKKVLLKDQSPPSGMDNSYQPEANKIKIEVVFPLEYCEVEPGVPSTFDVIAVDVDDESPYENDMPAEGNDNLFDQNYDPDPFDTGLYLDEQTNFEENGTAYCKGSLTFDLTDGMGDNLISGQNFKFQVKGQNAAANNLIKESATFVTWKQYSIIEANAKVEGSHIIESSPNSVVISNYVDDAYFKMGDNIILWYKDDIHKLSDGNIKIYEIAGKSATSNGVRITFTENLIQAAPKYSGIIKESDWNKGSLDYSTEIGLERAFGKEINGEDGGVFIEFVKATSNFYLPNFSFVISGPTSAFEAFIGSADPSTQSGIIENQQKYSYVLDDWLGNSADIVIVNGTVEDPQLGGITDSEGVNSTFINSFYFENNPQASSNPLNSSSDVLAHETAHHFFDSDSMKPNHIDTSNPTLIKYQHDSDSIISLMCNSRNRSDENMEFNYESLTIPNSMIHFLRKQPIQ